VTTNIADPTSVYVQGNYAYVIGQTGANLEIFNVSSPSSPVYLSFVSTVGAAESVFVQGSYAYVANEGEPNLQIINVSNPASPVLVGSVTTGQNTWSVSVQGNYAYVANYNSANFQIINISNPASPAIVGTVPTGTNPAGIFVQGNYAYVVNAGSASLQVFNLSGAYIQQLQAGGTETGTLQVDSNANVSGSESISGGLNVSGSEQVVGNLGAGGLNISGLATPAQPTLTVTTAGTTSYSYGLTANNGDGNSALSPTQTTALAAASLNNSTAYVEVSWPAVSGATTYNIYRTAGGSSQGSIGTVTSASTTASMTPTSGSETGTVLTLNFSSSVSWGLGQAITLAGFTMNTGSVNGTWPIVSVSGSTITINITAGVTSTISVEGTATGNSSGTIGFFDTAQTAGSAAPSVATAGTLTLATTSVNALQIENSTSASILDVDTSGNQTIFGNTTANAGQIVFDDGTNSNAVTINVGSGTANYSLTLPTIAPSTGQCLQSGAVTAGLLVFAACPGGGGSPIIQGGNNFGATTVIGSTGAYGLNLLADNAVVESFSATGAVAFSLGQAVSNFQIQNALGVTLLNADTINNLVDVGGLSAPGTPSVVQAPIAGTATGSGSGTSYTYEITAVSSNGAESLGATEVKASNGAVLSTNPITINWTTNGAAYYKVYRTASAGTPSSTGLIGETTTASFVDNGYAAGDAAPALATTGAMVVSTSYYYEVTALDYSFNTTWLNGESAVSAQVTGTTNTVNKSLTISWAPVPGARGYLVYRTTTSGTYTTDSYYQVGNNSFTDILGSATGTNLVPPTVNTGYADVLGLDTGNITIGNDGTATGDLYIGGNIPSSTYGTVTTQTAPNSVYIQGAYAYVVNQTSATLQIFDISNPASPVSVDGTGVATGTLPYSVYVQGRYAYVVNFTSASLQVFDVSNPASPTVVGTVTTSTGPESVYVQGRYAYVANYTAGTMEIFDVSNPASPVSVGSVATGTHPTSVFVFGRYAYVTNFGSNTLQVFDINNPAAPVSVGTATTGTTPQSVYVSGTNAYVTNYGSSTLQIFNVSNPANPVSVGTVTTGTEPYSVYVQGRYAYVTNYNATGLQVVNIANPSDPILITPTITTGTSPSSVYVSGRYAYVTNFGSASLQVFDLGGEYATQIQAGGVEVTTLTVDSNSQINGSEAITGGLSVSSSANVSGNLGVAGNLTLTGTLTGDNTLGIPIVATNFVGTSATTDYSYAVSAINAIGTSPASTASAITTGSATLSQATNYDEINWSGIAGATSYNVYRTLSTGTPASTGLIGTVVTNTTTTSPTPNSGSESGTTLTLNFTAAPAWVANQGVNLQGFTMNTGSINGIQQVLTNTGTVVTLYISGGVTSTISTEGTATGATYFFDPGVAASVATLPTVDTSTTIGISGFLTVNGNVLIGSNSSSNTTNLSLLQLNSVNTLAESSACAASTNQGALYYNYVSSTVRACIGGAWQDLVSTQGLSTLLFGVVPNSGNDPSDLLGASATAVAASNTGGPCKVNVDSVASGASSVYVDSCTAYSGGREVSVAATVVSISAVAASSYQNICLTAAGVPALLGSSSTTSGSQTFNTLTTTNGTTYGQPLLCLATIKTTAVAGTLSNIYDARTFTNTTKSYATIATAIDGYLGATVTPSNTAGLVVWSSSATGIIQGVVVASSGANGVAGSPNIMIATAGPQWMFGNAGTLNDFIVPTTTTGVAAGTAVAGLDGYDMLGVELNTYATSCAAQTYGATDCQYSLFTYLTIQ
jgi:hypothetical protein